jgi:hypothetical protein
MTSRSVGKKGGGASVGVTVTGAEVAVDGFKVAVALGVKGTVVEVGGAGVLLVRTVGVDKGAVPVRNRHERAKGPETRSSIKRKRNLIAAWMNLNIDPLLTLIELTDQLFFIVNCLPSVSCLPRLVSHFRLWLKSPFNRASNLVTRSERSHQQSPT